MAIATLIIRPRPDRPELVPVPGNAVVVPQSESHVAVARSPAVSWWKRGVAMTEVISSYGVYALLVVGGLAGAALIYNLIAKANVVQEARIIVDTVHRVYSAGGRYTGLTVKTFADLKVLPPEMVENPTDGLVLLGGEYQLLLGNGVDNPDTGLGATSSRYFIVQFGTLAHGLDDADLCIDLATGIYPRLRSVQILTGEDALAVVAPVATGAAALGYSDVVTADVAGDLADRAEGATLIGTACVAVTDAGTGAVKLVFN